MLTKKKKEIRARMGQYCFALGQGAGGVRVSRKAVDAFIKRYRPAQVDMVKRDFEDHVDHWQGVENQGNRVRADLILDLIAAVGRHAAYLATRAGRFAINVKDIDRAIDTVESNYGNRDPGSRGEACPI